MESEVTVVIVKEERKRLTINHPQNGKEWSYKDWE